MNDIKVIHANRSHKDFLIYANRVINDVNDTEQTKGLELNIDKDYFRDKPKFQCLVAEIDNKPVGMILYSYFYWANDGEALWISQMFVEEEYRKYGTNRKQVQNRLRNGGVQKSRHKNNQVRQSGNKESASRLRRLP